jgi:hypothetical protein
MKFLAACLTASLVFAADLPSGESLMQRALDQSGGAAAFEKVKTVAMTGNVEMRGHNISGPVAIFQQGEKNYTVIEFPGIGKAEEGYDGEIAWEMNALQGARIKDGEEKAAAVRNARMSLLGVWRDYYTAARTLGFEDVDGKAAWKVELTPTAGKPETFYFDKVSGLPVRFTQTVTTALGEIPVDVALGDYRVVDGIETPFTMLQKAMGQELAMRFDKVAYNAAIPDGRFDPPGPVKALAAKRKLQ